MSRKAIIGIKQTDGIVRSIYCISDGDLNKCGATLYKYYLTPERVNQLIDLGIVNKVGKYLVRKDLGEFTLPYNEEEKQINNYENKDEFIKDFFLRWAPNYNAEIEGYLFDEETKKWLVASSYSDKFIPFEEIIFGEKYSKKDANDYLAKLENAKENPSSINVSEDITEYYRSLVNIRIRKIRLLTNNLNDGDCIKKATKDNIQNYRAIREMITSKEPNIELFDKKQFQKKRFN